jgi:hypothetical protein
MTQNNNSNIIGDVAGAGFGILLLLGFTAGLYLADYQPESVSQSTASLLTGKNTNALKDLNRTADWSSAEGITGISDKISELYSN